MRRQHEGSMRVGKLFAIAFVIAGCGSGGAGPGTGAGGRGSAGSGVDGKAGAGQGGRTVLHRGESDGTGGVTAAAGGTTTPSQGGRAGGASAAPGQGGMGGGADLGGRTGSGPGQGGRTGGGVPTGGSSAGTGGAGQAGSAGSVIGGTGGGSGGQPVITGTGGQSGGNVGGTAGAAVATAGVGGRAAGGAGGAPGVVTACNAASCPTGCCDGNRCVDAPTALQCGLAGAACQTCAACQRCSASGACELDPQSRWQMLAVSATLAPLYSDGSAWDSSRDLYGGALPDPFVQFEMPVGNALGYTDTIVDSVAPIWNQAVIPASAAVRASDLLPGGTAWSLWVGDDDGNTYAELMCELTGPLTTADFAAGAFGRSGLDGCLTVSMRLVCAM